MRLSGCKCGGLHGRLGKTSRRDAGLTLIELLIVVTIVSIMALGVGLTGGGAFSRASNSAGSVADRFRGVVTQARDRAILGRRLIGLDPRGDGWHLLEQDTDGNWRGVALPTRVSGVAFAWQIDGQTYLPRLGPAPAGRRPAVLFTPDGRAQALRLVIGQQGRRITCTAGTSGAVTCE